MLRFVLVSGSTTIRSRSRVAAGYVQTCLQAQGVRTDFLDLREHPVGRCAEWVRLWNEADGWVVADAADNLASILSPLATFLHYGLQPYGRLYRPFLLIPGVLDGRRPNDFDLLAFRLIREAGAIPAGPPLVISGETVGAPQERLSGAVEGRLERATLLLAHLARAMGEFAGTGNTFVARTSRGASLDLPLTATIKGR